MLLPAVLDKALAADDDDDDNDGSDGLGGALLLPFLLLSTASAVLALTGGDGW